MLILTFILHTQYTQHNSQMRSTSSPVWSRRWRRRWRRCGWSAGDARTCAYNAYPCCGICGGAPVRMLACKRFHRRYNCFLRWARLCRRCPAGVSGPDFAFAGGGGWRGDRIGMHMLFVLNAEVCLTVFVRVYGTCDYPYASFRVQ